MSNNDKFKELYKAIGVLAETGILFYRATIQAGATPGEAMILTQAFIRASMQGDDTSASERTESKVNQYSRRRFCGNGHLQY